MNIGDVVIPKPNSGIVLHCGTGCYTHAIVASINPFVIISVDGSMRWDTENISNYISLCKADNKIIEIVMDKNMNVPVEIMKLLIKETINKSGYINPHFLSELSRILYEYYNLEDEQVDKYIENMWSM